MHFTSYNNLVNRPQNGSGREWKKRKEATGIRQERTMKAWPEAVAKVMVRHDEQFIDDRSRYNLRLGCPGASGVTGVHKVSILSEYVMC